MRPKWPKLASLAVTNCPLYTLRFFDVFFAFKNTFEYSLVHIMKVTG